MVSSNSKSSTKAAFEDWLKAQIQQLSVDTSKSEAMTCTACGEALGTYIIDYKSERFRYSTEQTDAFLKFISEKGDESRI